MISEIAWENIHWLKDSFFDRLEQVGGSSISVESFRPYLTREWIKGLNPVTVRQQFLVQIAEWTDKLNTTRLTKNFKMKHWNESTRVPRGGEEYSEILWFLMRSHYNLYSLTTHRKTIEELALGSYTYCSLSSKPERKKVKSALADFKRLLRLSNLFLNAEWVKEMIERADANKDKEFFRILSNSARHNIMSNPSPTATNWMLVVLLWFLGGKNIKPRREFLHILQQNEILSNQMEETPFRSQLATFGLTRT